MLRWLLGLVGFGRWRCDGCGVERLRVRERATPRVERVRVGELADAPGFTCCAVRLYCRACAAARKEG